MTDVIFHLKKGTRGKLIELLPDAHPIVRDWTLRKDFDLIGCLMDPIVVKAMAQKVPSQHYALFAGDSGCDRNARFVFAVQYHEVEVIPLTPKR